MADAEGINRLDNLESRVAALEADVRGMGGLLDQLKRAVVAASNRGDALAGVVKADSPEQMVKNLIAHFEAIGEMK